MKEKQIETVLSDIGNVCWRFDNGKTARALEPYSNSYNAKQIEFMMFHPKHTMQKFFDRGQMDACEFRAAYRSLLDLHDISDDAFDEAYADVFTPIEETLALWRKLREAGVLVVAVSNVDELRWAHLLQLGADKMFDGYMLSFAQGVSKPDPGFINMAIDHFASSPSTTVFTDDLEHNLLVPDGIRTHHFQGTPGLKKFLADEGLRNLIYPN